MSPKTQKNAEQLRSVRDGGACAGLASASHSRHSFRRLRKKDPTLTEPCRIRSPCASFKSKHSAFLSAASQRSGWTASYATVGAIPASPSTTPFSHRARTSLSRGSRSGDSRTAEDGQAAVLFSLPCSAGPKPWASCRAQERKGLVAVRALLWQRLQCFRWKSSVAGYGCWLRLTGGHVTSPWVTSSDAGSPHKQT